MRAGASAWATFASWDSQGNRTMNEDARRLQVAGFHRPSVTGFARSIGWLSMYVGLEFVYRRGAAMAHRAADLLADIDGVTLLTQRDRMAGLISFQVAGWEIQAALDEL